VNQHLILSFDAHGCHGDVQAKTLSFDAHGCQGDVQTKTQLASDLLMTLLEIQSVLQLSPVTNENLHSACKLKSTVQ
jgi:hypothetical protein